MHVPISIYSMHDQNFQKEQHCTKNEVFHQGFLRKIWPKPWNCGLGHNSEEILNGKLHFLCSAIYGKLLAVYLQWKSNFNKIWGIPGTLSQNIPLQIQFLIKLKI